MGATLRITWPLLSLSFLFLSICSNTNSETTPTMNNPVPATSGPSATPIGPIVPGTVPTTIKTVTVGGKSAVPPTLGAVRVSQTVGAPTPATPAAVTTPAVIVTSQLPGKPNSAGPQVPTGPNNPPALPIITAGPLTTMRIDTTTAATTAAATIAVATTAVATASAAPAATTSPPKTMGPVTTADSRGGTVFTHNAPTGQTSKASAAGKTSGTRAPAVTTKASAVGVTSGRPSGAHTTIATKTSPHSIGGAEKTTMALAGSRGTAGGATQPAGSSSPSTLTNAGPTPPLGTEAGTTAPQAPIATTTTITNTRTTNSRTINSRTINTGTINTRTINTGTPGSTAAQLNTFSCSLNDGHEKVEEKDLVELCKLCKQLMVNLQDGNCTVTWRRHNDKTHVVTVAINGEVKTSVANQYYEDITRKPTDNKTLIAILASCGALLIMIVILAVCASHHRKPYNDNQQHLTEELHTVENGYHDNPTLEVMEVQPEMQEKKMMSLNGEFNDSWIVPIDNLLKEDVADEEDTHL